jgi:hypothetical protein
MVIEEMGPAPDARGMGSTWASIEEIVMEIMQHSDSGSSRDARMSFEVQLDHP